MISAPVFFPFVCPPILPSSSFCCVFLLGGNQAVAVLLDTGVGLIVGSSGAPWGGAAPSTLLSGDAAVVHWSCKVQRPTLSSAKLQ